MKNQKESETMKTKNYFFDCVSKIVVDVENSSSIAQDFIRESKCAKVIQKNWRKVK